jgi:hypothetical protein
MLVANVIAGPLFLVILTLNEVKGKNLSLRVNYAWQCRGWLQGVCPSQWRKLSTCSLVKLDKSMLYWVD